MVAVETQGAIIAVDAIENGWVRLIERFCGGFGWVMIESQAIQIRPGLTQTLLRQVFGDEIEAYDALARECHQRHAEVASELEEMYTSICDDYDVILQRVVVHSAPSTSAPRVAIKLHGEHLSVDAEYSGWLRLVERFPSSSGSDESGEGWVLCDGGADFAMVSRCLAPTYRNDNASTASAERAARWDAYAKTLADDVAIVDAAANEAAVATVLRLAEASGAPFHLFDASGREYSIPNSRVGESTAAPPVPSQGVDLVLSAPSLYSRLSNWWNN